MVLYKNFLNDRHWKQTLILEKHMYGFISKKAIISYPTAISIWHSVMFLLQDRILLSIASYSDRLDVPGAVAYSFAYCSNLWIKPLNKDSSWGFNIVDFLSNYWAVIIEHDTYLAEYESVIYIFSITEQVGFVDQHLALLKREDIFKWNCIKDIPRVIFIVAVYDRSRGRAGGPTTGCDIKLVDWEEGNYRVSDKPFPRGEIIIGK